MMLTAGPQTLIAWIVIGSLGTAAVWSVFLDRNKPPDWGEKLAKFAARTLFILVVAAVLLSFLYLAASVVGSYRS